MKIVFTSIFRPGMGGGAGRVAHELAIFFAKDHDVVMICPAEKTEVYLDENGVIYYGIRSAGNTEFQMPDLSTKTIRELFDFLDDFQPQIVHAHEPAFVGLIGQVWARMNSVPFVHTSHVLPSKAKDFGTSDTFSIPLLQNSISDFAITGVLSNFFQNCDALIALNQSALESIEEFGYKGPIYIIPNGRALTHFNKCHYADINSDVKTLAFIGFLNKRKNQSYLLKVIRKLPGNYQLRLAGRPLNQSYQDELDAYIKKHELKNIEFVGQISQDQIPNFLEQAHIFASASIMEVQSLVVIEALASGTPVVGLSNETIDELINDQVGVRIDKDQKPAEFARQVEKICNLPPHEYILMCKSARQRVAHLDWTKVVDQTINAYQDLLQTKPSISIDESDMLTSLVTFLTEGDLRDFLLEAIKEARQELSSDINLLPKVKIPESFRTWIRVPSSTWLISGVTILASVLGYLFMRGRGKKELDLD
jgi:glycosyltransferase involved in cell wall biosynthesis